MNRDRVYLSSLVSVVYLAFLIYTLFNLGSLRISASHPRIIVEASIFLIGLILAIKESQKM